MDIKKYLDDLKVIVNTDSYSYDAQGKSKILNFFKLKFESIGWETEEIFLNDEVGSILVSKNTSDDKFDVILSGHMDTVFKHGTTQERPFKIENQKAYGPGVADMKSGLLSGFYVCEMIENDPAIKDKKICVIFNPDEEISSIYSRNIIEKYAEKTSYAIIMEAARSNGNMVNERKGISKYVVEFIGKSAHAAVDPQNGANAINAFLDIGKNIIDLACKEKGTSINIGTIEGGTTPNTVPDYVKIQIDCRFSGHEESKRLDNYFNSLHKTKLGNSVELLVSGGIKRPPWKLTEQARLFCKRIDDIKKRNNIVADWESTAGGSDGNFFAAKGVTTIDGMGPVGGKWHSPNEYLDIDTIEERTMLVYQIIKHCL